MIDFYVFILCGPGYKFLYKLCRNDAYCLKEKFPGALYCRCAASSIPDKFVLVKNLISRLMLAKYICKTMDILTWFLHFWFYFGMKLCSKWSYV